MWGTQAHIGGEGGGGGGVKILIMLWDNLYCDIFFSGKATFTFIF